MKELITSKFDKSKFRINAMSTHDEGDIDPRIVDLVNKLNESEDIMTIYSCEGHKDGDSAYLYFNVSEKGWDIFWLNIMPELSEKFLTVKPEFSKNALYQLQWTVHTKDNEFNTGINVFCTLEPFLKIYTWEDKKEEFWNVVEEVFLKHFK